MTVDFDPYVVSPTEKKRKQASEGKILHTGENSYILCVKESDLDL